MNVIEILESARNNGADVLLDGNQLRVRYGRRLSPDLLAAIIEHKREIASLVRLRERTVEQTAPCGSLNCAGCYEIEPGRRIHPPKVSQEWKMWLEKWQPAGGHKAN